jgi:hypothetical protein
MSSSAEEINFFSNASYVHAIVRSTTFMLVTLGLWGVLVFLFERFRINYVKILQDDFANETKAEKELISLSDGVVTERIDDSHEPTTALLDSTASVRLIGSETTLEGLLSGDERLAKDGFIPSSAITWQRLVCTSLVLLIMLHGTFFVWNEIIGGGGNQLGPILISHGLLMLAIVRLQWFRQMIMIVLCQCCELFRPRFSWIFPSATKPVTFASVILADVACSFTPVIADWSFFLLNFVYPSASLRIRSSFLHFCEMVPFIIRMQQCLVMWSYDTCHYSSDSAEYKKRRLHLINALRYAAFFMPVILLDYCIGWNMPNIQLFFRGGWWNLFCSMFAVYW